MTDNSNKITKYRRPLNLNIGMLIFAAIFVYVVVCVVAYFKTEHIVGYSVKEGSLSSTSIYKGIALLDEEIVTESDASNLDFIFTCRSL